MSVEEEELKELKELKEALEGTLSHCVRGGRRVARVECRPSPYQTSFPLAELSVFLDDGTHLDLLLKDLAAESLTEAARSVKPAFLHRAGREIAVYQTLLAPRGIGPVLHGALDDPARNRQWLFLERVAGVELFQVGDEGVWAETARWLGRFHAEFQGEPGLALLADQGPLLRYDAALLGRWLERARTFASRSGVRVAPTVELLERLGECHPQVVSRILESGETLVHGEFYPSNVLIKTSGPEVVVVPVDWELAGVGSGLLDLAALVAGGWPEEEKARLALAYREAFQEAGGEPVAGGEPFAGRDEFLESLDCARLQIAIQWMGWAPDWSPPPEHVQDWIREAERLLTRLGF